MSPDEAEAIALFIKAETEDRDRERLAVSSLSDSGSLMFDDIDDRFNNLSSEAR
jgi:hypothetical protein